MAGGRVPFGDCPVGVLRLGFAASTQGCTQKRARDAQVEAARGVGGPGRPFQAAASSGGPGSPRRGRFPTPSAPHAGGSAQAERGPRPRAARLHLRTWDAGQRVPGSPSHSSGLPGSGPPPTEKHPGCEGQASSYLGRGLPRRWGRVRRSGRRAAAARGSGSDFLLLRLGPAARPRSPARPRPGPPLSAASCGLRRPPAAGPASRLPSVLGRGRWGGGGGGERKRKRLSTWTCLWSVAKESSQITAPGGKS